MRNKNDVVDETQVGNEMNDINGFFDYIAASAEAKLIITGVIILVVLIAAWLLLRNIRLWYWKTDRIIDSIDEIGQRVLEMEKNIDQIKIKTEVLLTNQEVPKLEEKVEETIELAAVFSGKKLLESEVLEILSENVEEEQERAKQEEERLQSVTEALAELEKQKEQLEADINARIRT